MVFVMELNIVSDESSDADVRAMKNQLTEFGLDEDNLSKEEMVDLLTALNNSKSSAKEDEILRQKVDDIMTIPSPKALKRRYLNVRDRRMPWCLLSSNITQIEKARLLSAYIKMMSVNKYKQARKLGNFVPWPTNLHINQESQDSSSRVHSLRSTRSGRSVPVYADLDDDSSDVDLVVTKPKKRKTSGDNADGVYTNRVVSLKRKPSKDENTRPIKEFKVSNTTDVLASTSKSKKDVFSVIED